MQAESDWKKKRDEGYKNLNDLGIRFPGETGIFSTTDNDYGTLEAALNNELPQFNTDANGNVKPIMAKHWDGGKKVKYPCYIQPKLDGVRCLMIVEATEGDVPDTWHHRVTLQSRSGKEYTTLQHIAHEVLASGLMNSKETIILYGEIYYPVGPWRRSTKL